MSTIERAKQAQSERREQTERDIVTITKVGEAVGHPAVSGVIFTPQGGFSANETVFNNTRTAPGSAAKDERVIADMMRTEVSGTFPEQAL